MECNMFEEFRPHVAIKVEGLVYRYNSSNALDGLTFEVKKGEFVGLVGPNGSGKTTLLKCLAKVLEPKEGVILLDGRDLRRMAPLEVARTCASVPSEFPADANLSVVDTVLLGRYPHLKGLWWESEEDEKVALESMKRMGISKLAGKRMGELSSGEKQRVLIAKALAQEAKVLLVDEPVAYLDLRYQLEIMDVLKKLTGGGVTIIAAMHQLNLATRYCDELIVLKQGRIVAFGKPEEVVGCDLIEDVYGVRVLVEKIPRVGVVVIPVEAVNSGEFE